MLIPEKTIQGAMSLLPADVRSVLQRSGYDAQDIYATRFMGMNPNGTFVYEIDYEDDNGDEATGNIYIKIEREPMSTNFQYRADY